MRCDISVRPRLSGYHTLCYKQAPSWYDMKYVERDAKSNTEKSFCQMSC